jgi:thiol:disulfide interchange protein DsbC
VSKVDCARITGLCEVQAGTNIFYVDLSARFLIVGRVYDMATRQDLTAARLLEINPDELLGGAASAQSGNDGAGLGGEARASTALTAAAPPAQKVSLAELPASGAIEWGGAGRKVTVFSDFHCGYCRMLHQSLKDMGVRVIERPISVLGTRAISEAVVCADNPASAVEKAYSDQDIPKRACDTSGLDANERFAREHGFSGTPVIVRDDGAVVLGFRPRAFLEVWLKGGA